MRFCLSSHPSAHWFVRQLWKSCVRALISPLRIYKLTGLIAYGMDTCTFKLCSVSCHRLKSLNILRIFHIRKFVDHLSFCSVIYAVSYTGKKYSYWTLRDISYWLWSVFTQWHSFCHVRRDICILLILVHNKFIEDAFCQKVVSSNVTYLYCILCFFIYAWCSNNTVSVLYLCKL